MNCFGFSGMKAFFLVFLSIFFCDTISWAQNSQITTAYIAIAGPSDGAGMMGHVFILFSEKPDQFLNSISYQYAAKFPEDFTFNLKSASQLSSLPFIVTKQPGWGFIKKYNAEGRYIHLYELDMSPEQVLQTQRNIEEDMANRSSLEYFDYSVTSSNCATKIYDQLNKVFGSEVFKYSSPTSAMYNFSFIRPKTIALTVPLSAALHLKSSPAVKKVVKFRSEDMMKLESNLVGANELKNLASICHTNDKTLEALINIFGNSELVETKSYLDLVQSLFSKCLADKPEAESSYHFHLDFIRFRSQNLDFIELVEDYYI